VIPKSKEAVKDALIAGAFIAMGTLLPGSLLDKGFEAHVGGIALGIGIGWLVKSIIDTKGVQRES
jgi:membrane associated rhomboid family serine protease